MEGPAGGLGQRLEALDDGAMYEIGQFMRAIGFCWHVHKTCGCGGGV